MSYCLNPACPHPENLTHTEFCQACGASLLLRNRYRVIQTLGQGGFGATFLAKDESLPGHPSCVIKQLRLSTDSQHVMDMARDLFQREAKTLGKLGSTNTQVPRLLDYFEDNQEFYLIQEFISGSNLQQEVKRGGPFTEAGVKQFLTEILPLMQYIHEQEVIHRDIKPANIIRRTQDKKLVLIDFGAVKDEIDPVAANSPDQTALTSYAVGTPGYAPPEQMMMRPVYASDLYALGATCVYLLSGKSPKDLRYDPTTGEMLWHEHVQISEHFSKVLRKMLEVAVGQRYQNAGEILRALDLEPYLKGLEADLVNRSNLEQQEQIRRTSNYEAARNNTFGQSSGLNSGQSAEESLPPSGPSGGRSLSQAEQIRRRRLRQESKMQSKEITSGIPRSLTQQSGNSSRTKNRKTAKRLNEEGLKTAYIKGRLDFSYYDLRSLKLNRSSFPRAKFHGANLQNSKFEGANLSDVDFGRANLHSASFQGAKLERAYFHQADLEDVDLRGATLHGAHFKGANLRRANLSGANLTGAVITDTQLALAKTNWRTILPNGKRK